MNAESVDVSDDSLWDVKQAAPYLNMSVKWLYGNYKTIPHIRIGSGSKPRIKFRKRDLDEWVRRRRIQ